MIVFHLMVFTIVVTSYAPIQLPAHPVLLKSLFSGTDKGYLLPASELGPLKPLVSKMGVISVITDHPFAEDKKEQEFSHDVQNYLCPLLIDNEPRRPVALVYCSSNELAERRLSEAGYRWAGKVADGKGIAIKNS